MMPGATKFLTLADMQDFTVTYNQGENIGLIAKAGSSGIGMFVLDKTEEVTRRIPLIQTDL